MLSFFSFIDWILFTFLTLCVAYFLIFAIASLFYREKQYPNTETRHRFLVLFPAYAEDAVIVNSIKTFLQQDYPKEYYQIVTISDHQKEGTVRQLLDLPIITLIATYKNSTKAKAMKLAIDKIEGNFDTVVVLDADNLAPSNFLSEINKMRVSGAKAIQVHRRGIINDSPIALLDDVSEEINNGIFRKGHQTLGLSSALTGSGMAFDYTWFKSNIGKANSAGEDKELEIMLLNQRIQILYSDKLYVFDKKTDKQATISKQRKRWMASQYSLVLTSIPYLGKALFSLNISYADKIIQWILPPRLIQLALIFGITLVMLIFLNFSHSEKWLYLSLAQILAMLISIPSHCWNKKLIFSLTQAPILTVKVIKDLFHLKGASKLFIHTKHE
ncbi:MAG: glycosyltransferase [Bacteroidales bacterium]|jgi:Glycosyltransferases, probably involved in cell wall biogenesis|nr:glycosyltransferase [Bacteroidales bacterium]